MVSSRANHNKDAYNAEVVPFAGKPVEREYRSVSAVEYSYTIETESEKSYNRDVFFEVGDYVYNVCVSVELPNKDYETFVNLIINSIQAEPLDSNEVGIFMKNVPVATGLTKAKFEKVTMYLPNIYVDMSESGTLAYLGPINGVMVSCVRIQATNASADDLRRMMAEAEAGYKTEGGIVVKSLHQKTLNRQSYQSFCVKVKSDDENVYLEQLACLYKGYVYVFTIGCSELTYSENTQAEITQIIGSIKFE